MISFFYNACYWKADNNFLKGKIREYIQVQNNSVVKTNSNLYIDYFLFSLEI